MREAAQLSSESTKRSGPKTACLTLDLESDWFIDEPGEQYLTLDFLPEYIELIERLEVPVTVFVVGQLLEDRPEEVARLRRELPVEFQLHSYEHDPAMPDGFRQDLDRGIEAFESFFGRRPEGYRAPLGKLSKSQLETVGHAGFEFDSSIFPSYRPGVYNNLSAPTTPYYPNPAGRLLELPVGVLPYARIPAAQSYIKLGGRPLLELFCRAPLPEPFVFVSHLHDFFESEALGHRSQPMKAIQQRNLDQSAAMFTELVERLRDRGYRFTTLGEAARTTGVSQRETHQPAPPTSRPPERRPQ